MARVGLPILVVKIGTSALLGEHEAPRVAFDVVAQNIKSLSDNYKIILVTSGAIGFGVRTLRLNDRPKNLSKLQALAMIGQAGLLNRWGEAFGDIAIGQVLVTRHDLEMADEGRSFRSSIEAVWQYGGIPVVNENDAVSYEEISFGDNDRLAAEVAINIGAEKLVLLTDQNGIQSGFGTDKQARLEVLRLDDAGQYIVDLHSKQGKGGAASKLQAACTALESGVQVYIGRVSGYVSVLDIISGQSGTRIVQ